MEPIDEDRKPPKVGAGVPVLPEEIVRTLYRPGPEDWGGLDRDSECDRISAELSKVDHNIFPFYTSVVEYPINLSIIKSRLDNRFYRRTEAVEFDVNYLLTNARKFYKANSPIIRSASSATKLCLEMIRNRDAVEIPTNYQLLTTNAHPGPHSPASAPSSPNSTEDVKSDSSDLSMSAQLPITNGSGKRGLKRKGRPDATKLKSLRKRKVPPNVNFEPPDESSSEDEKPMRYILCLFSILSFNFLFIYLYFCKSVKEDESL